MNVLCWSSLYREPSRGQVIAIRRVGVMLQEGKQGSQIESKGEVREHLIAEYDPEECKGGSLIRLQSAQPPELVLSVYGYPAIKGGMGETVFFKQSINGRSI